LLGESAAAPDSMREGRIGMEKRKKERPSLSRHKGLGIIFLLDSSRGKGKEDP